MLWIYYVDIFYIIVKWAQMVDGRMFLYHMIIHKVLVDIYIYLA